MKLDMTILYVTDLEASVAFLTTVLGAGPVDLSPGFAMFILAGGLKLGLWIDHGVKPASPFTGAGSELVIHVEADGEVETLHEKWTAAGLSVIDPPVRREFGYSFVAEGPDAHRVRVLKPAA